jgi:predicted nucleic acid-binding protein
MAFLSQRATTGMHEISQISAMTLIADAKDSRERRGLGMFFSWCVIYPVTAHTIRRAQSLLENLQPPTGLTANDAVVAATALAHKLPLYTLDPGRFAQVAGLSAISPY